MNGLPAISRCDVTNCFYNQNKSCHAPAINVGGDHHPACDTFIANQRHITRKDAGLVGACHVAECRFNSDLLCSANNIVVRNHADHADCDTYQKT